jgi:site-specific DNA-cytosine methylase
VAPCDIGQTQQGWFRQHFNPTFIFCDVQDMGAEFAYDLCAGQQQRVPSAYMAIAGSECDNFSSLNFFTRAPEEGVLRTTHGKSGSTLRGVIEYIVTHRPRLFVLENVANLDGGAKYKDNDLVALQDKLRSLVPLPGDDFECREVPLPTVSPEVLHLGHVA